MPSEKTNPIGAGTQNVTCNISDDLRAAIKDLADRSGPGRVGVGTYISCLLVIAADRGIVLNNVPELRARASNVRSNAGQWGRTAGLPKREKKQLNLKPLSDAEASVAGLVAKTAGGTPVGGGELSSPQSGAGGPGAQGQEQPRPFSRGSKTRRPDRGEGRQR